MGPEIRNYLLGTDIGPENPKLLSTLVGPEDHMISYGAIMMLGK